VCHNGWDKGDQGTWLGYGRDLGRGEVGHAEKREQKKRKRELGRLRIGPKKVLKKSKGFSISCFDSNSNSIRVWNEIYTNLKLKHSIKSKQNASSMKCIKIYIYRLN
jgi:hypothetical protein